MHIRIVRNFENHWRAPLSTIIKL